MFIGFELTDYQSLTRPTDLDIWSFNALNEARVSELARYIVSISQTSRHLDAEEISASLFPQLDYDIFLSHSHADQSKAIELALSLRDKGIRVFVDSCVWGHSEELIKLILEQSGPLENETRESQIGRVSAAVHTLLSAAIHQMIWRTEAFVFLRTERSVPFESDVSDRTLSPWIYAELQFSAQVQQMLPQRLKNKKTLQSVAGFESYMTESKQLPPYEMVFKISKEHLPSVKGNDLSQWYHDLPKKKLTERGDVLDDLYATCHVANRYYEHKIDNLALL
ncbi:toll/interleukin-1 receptor domain-containing protein [Pseudomonas monteilii]|uniref:toll/interleukin-1 receptor domain-containing protein n=1 Tax=Pseudomonas monteilii TaxID=76759 RepID=UPI001FD630BF|nr:toll/interleukin-1 receptor domain-containing protein [Pseudomonas monteilii]MCJ7853021.1 toll/interleukin-1 receptor domain-containing protein [Pseudomonas monteilii]